VGRRIYDQTNRSGTHKRRHVSTEIATDFLAFGRFIMIDNVHQNANQNTNNKLPFKLVNISNKLKKILK
jgi:hypothetical protein